MKRSWCKPNLARSDRMCRTIQPGQPELMVSRVKAQGGGELVLPEFNPLRPPEFNPLRRQL